MLHARDRYGRDADWIEYHPAYREMEKIVWGDFQMAAMSHRPGALGWPEVTAPPIKYAFQYMFAQAEFGILCPLSVTETSGLSLRMERRSVPEGEVLGEDDRASTSTST